MCLHFTKFTMGTEKLNHELGQLAAMFYELGKAAGEAVGGVCLPVDENEVATMAVDRENTTSVVANPSPQPILKAV